MRMVSGLEPLGPPPFVDFWKRLPHRTPIKQATNAVNSAVGHVFMPVLPARPSVQLQLAQ
jgi:hypothetical protein